MKYYRYIVFIFQAPFFFSFNSDKSVHFRIKQINGIEQVIMMYGGKSIQTSFFFTNNRS